MSSSQMGPITTVASRNAAHLRLLLRIPAIASGELMPGGISKTRPEALQRVSGVVKDTNRVARAQARCISQRSSTPCIQEHDMLSHTARNT